MHAETCLNNPFDRRNLLPAGWRNRPLASVAAPLVDLVPGIRNCRQHFSALPSTDDAGAFAQAVLDTLQIKVTCSDRELAGLPTTSGAIVVANHPFGALDGLILLALLHRRRQDVRILANHLLERIPQLRGALLPVDVLDPKQGARQNSSSLRRGVQWVKNGGLLVIFPAGEVAHLKLRQGSVVDPPWSPSIARLVRCCQAPVYPVHFSGRNSVTFQAAGLVHPLLRTALLPRELLNKRGASVRVRIGSGIRPKRFARYSEPQQLIDYLRLQTFLLDNTGSSIGPLSGTTSTGMAALGEALPGEALRQELAALPSGQCLLQAGAMEVWQAEATQIPLLLQEIGRLRETTFRAVGEGTGRSIDLDRFDAHYRHLFLWNRETQEIAGAYRIGAIDDILARHGIAGLYTAELFRYQPDFFRRLGPALELGRSFIRESYQRSFTPLLLLWQGIGQFLVQNPRYRSLFGPVSISSDYSEISRRILSNTLWEQLKEPELAALVLPRTPFPVDFPRVTQCSLDSARALLADMNDVDALIDDLEPEQRGIPVLLRHYLNLGGKVLALNLDHDFQQVVDALIKVDLDTAPSKALERYMGKSGLAAYRNPQHRAGMNPSGT